VSKHSDQTETAPRKFKLGPPDPGCLARSKPWRPVHQRPVRDQRRPTWKKWERWPSPASITANFC